MGLDDVPECYPTCGQNSELCVIAPLARRREHWGGKQGFGWGSGLHHYAGDVLGKGFGVLLCVLTF